MYNYCDKMPGTRAMEGALKEEFEEWYARSLATGAVSETKDKIEYWPGFCICKVETIERARERARIEAEQLVQDRVGGIEVNNEEDREEDRPRPGARKEQWEVRADDHKKVVERIKLLNGFGRTLRAADGGAPGELREWLAHIERAGRVSHASGEEIVHFALKNSRGMLTEVIDAAWAEEEMITWADVADVISETLLTSDERAHLREELEKIKQGREESEAVYCQRFRMAARKAYDLAGLIEGGDSLERLVVLFMNSLRNHNVVLELEAARPKTLEEAYKLSITRGRAERKWERRVREEDGESIDAVSLRENQRRQRNRDQRLEGYNKGERDGNEEDSNSYRQTSKKMQNEMKALKKMIEGLIKEKELATIAAVTPVKVLKGEGITGGEDWRREQQRPMGGRDARPPLRCWGCGGPHMQRNCNNFNGHNGNPNGGYGYNGNQNGNHNGHNGGNNGYNGGNTGFGGGRNQGNNHPGQWGNGGNGQQRQGNSGQINMSGN